MRRNEQIQQIKNQFSLEYQRQQEQLFQMARCVKNTKCHEFLKAKIVMSCYTLDCQNCIHITASDFQFTITCQSDLKYSILLCLELIQEYRQQEIVQQNVVVISQKYVSCGLLWNVILLNFRALNMVEQLLVSIFELKQFVECNIQCGHKGKQTLLLPLLLTKLGYQLYDATSGSKIETIGKIKTNGAAQFVYAQQAKALKQFKKTKVQEFEAEITFLLFQNQMKQVNQHQNISYEYYLQGLTQQSIIQPSSIIMQATPSNLAQKVAPSSLQINSLQFDAVIVHERQNQSIYRPHVDEPDDFKSETAFNCLSQEHNECLCCSQAGVSAICDLTDNSLLDSNFAFRSYQNLNEETCNMQGTLVLEDAEVASQHEELINQIAVMRMLRSQESQIYARYDKVFRTVLQQQTKRIDMQQKNMAYVQNLFRRKINRQNYESFWGQIDASLNAEPGFALSYFESVYSAKSLQGTKLTQNDHFNLYFLLQQHSADEISFKLSKTEYYTNKQITQRELAFECDWLLQNISKI
ncbi:Hypothetical_protein [Hexamita inflata]|uniref:Hypothetical_protein n=1 Tax=Hexamita inflata TaxID=28002 RepID=A0AA86RG28_9EUKA|nr:Hypothetical protein HINF_LOCUS2822 [Hexamita inflata]CAI9977115.1 Hypothetical protein HINF_LOCUS64760 [Hexamita inflata]